MGQVWGFNSEARVQEYMAQLRIEDIPVARRKFDLNGNGVEIATLDRSTTFVDSNGDGLQHRTAWAGTGDGVLFYDAGNDGMFKETREYVFTEWDASAKDDIAALRSRFDSNGDGKLTAADAEFAKFKVMVTNADGSQTAMTLAQLGITEMNLKTDATQISFADGSQITGQTTFTMGGVTKTAAAVTLVAEAEKILAGSGFNGQFPGERGVFFPSSFGLPSVFTRGESRTC